MMNPVIFALFLALLCIFCAGIGICFLKMNSSTLPFWEKLPRNRMAGSVIGTVALLCFIPNVRPLFSPEENLYWLIPAALALSALCTFYLDLLFARACAGAMILLVHFLLAQSFNADLKGRSLFALLCFAAGSFAILIAAKPYWLRDCFRKMCQYKSWKNTAAAFLFLWSFCSLFLLIQLVGKGFAS